MKAAVVASLAVTGAMLFGSVSTASADTGDAGTCAFNGFVEVGPIPAPPAGVTQGGYFVFDGRANCVGVLGGSAVLPAVPPATNTVLKITGQYLNTACGTWLAGTSTPTFVGSALLGNEEFELTIVFVGGTGVMVITPTDGTGYAGAGVVNIVATNLNPPNDIGCVTAPAFEFRLNGAFAIFGVL